MNGSLGELSVIFFIIKKTLYDIILICLFLIFRV